MASDQIIPSKGLSGRQLGAKSPVNDLHGINVNIERLLSSIACRHSPASMQELSFVDEYKYRGHATNFSYSLANFLSASKFMTMNDLSTSALDGKVLADIRQSIAEFIQRCGLQYKNITLDEAWYSECSQEAINRGYPMDTILPYMAVGVAIMTNAYDHLPDRATKMWICLFTAVSTCIDDMMVRAEDLVHVYRFNERFANCQLQEHPVLNVLDGLLREVPCHYSAPVSNLIVASSLNFMSSILLDNETQDMPISPQTPSYPEYSRLLSGSADAYGFCIFPCTLPLREYVQCMPDLTIVINHTNDILSYYKEEIECDSANYLSLIAASRALTKQDALRELIEKTVQAYHNVLEFLRPRPEAYDAYVAFFDGYVKFHATLRRYKLEEVMSERLSS